MTLDQRRRRDGENKPVHYPERDGRPMGETETHIREIMRLIQTLDGVFADRPDVYVGGDLLVYYEEGNPRAVVVPDVFVVLGAPKVPWRRIYKLWEEGLPPTFVIEVTSPSTRREDMARKRTLYARLGVSEYVLYDPLDEYLRPPLQGYRLVDGDYRAMETGRDGALLSGALNMRLMLVDGRLRLFDRQSGAMFLSAAERTDAATQRADAEAAARREAERRVAELEALLRERGQS